MRPHYYMKNSSRQNERNRVKWEPVETQTVEIMPPDIENLIYVVRNKQVMFDFVNGYLIPNLTYKSGEQMELPISTERLRKRLFSRN